MDSYDRRIYTVNAIAWLVILVIGIIVVSTMKVRAEPGDKYDIPQRLTALGSKAAGGGTPVTQASGRPYGCDVRRYCGCAVAIRVFGRAEPKLFKAANWLNFPRTFPAPGMVAARRGHVMQLIAPVSGREWLVYDPNSGGGLTREHVRSISGFKIVNPRSGA